jgi:hypothetical protein
VYIDQEHEDATVRGISAFLVFWGARITPWCGAVCTDVPCVEHPWSRFCGGWLCSVGFHTGTFPPVVTCFPVPIPTWCTSELEIISGGVFK